MSLMTGLKLEGSLKTKGSETAGTTLQNVCVHKCLYMFMFTWTFKMLSRVGIEQFCKAKYRQFTCMLYTEAHICTDTDIIIITVVPLLTATLNRSHPL